MIEVDAELLEENSLVILLELFLRRRQVRADRIVDQIEHQAAVRLAVANFVELCNARMLRSKVPLPRCLSTFSSE